MGARLGISTEAAQKQCERARARLARELAGAGVLSAASMFTRWVIGGGVAAALVVAWRNVHPQPRPESSDAMLSARPDFQRTMPGKPAIYTPDAATIPGPIATRRPDFSEIAALLERADDGDVTAAVTAEKALSDCDPAALLAAAATLRDMPLPVNQLRVLALGMVRHLVSRDPKTAVPTGERLWRAQHGSSAPILASLVDKALARWHRTDPAAAAR